MPHGINGGPWGYLGEGVEVDDQGQLGVEVLLGGDHSPQSLHQLPVVLLWGCLSPQLFQQGHYLSLGLDEDWKHLFCITVTETEMVRSSHLAEFVELNFMN